MYREISFWEYIRQWFWPSYRKPDVSGLFVRVQQAPTIAVKREKDNYTTIGYNAQQEVVKARIFEFTPDGSTEFADVITVNKAGAKRGDVVKELTAADMQELSKRKPVVSEKAAQTIKEVFAAKGGAVYSSELQDMTGYSKAYCDVCLAAFRAALLQQEGVN